MLSIGSGNGRKLPEYGINLIERITKNKGGKVMVSKLEKNREGGWQVTVDLPEGKFCRIFHYKVDAARLIQDIDNIVERVRNYGLNGYFRRRD